MFRRKSDRGRIDSELGKEKRITKKKQGGVVVVMVCVCVYMCEFLFQNVQFRKARFDLHIHTVTKHTEQNYQQCCHIKKEEQS